MGMAVVVRTSLSDSILHHEFFLVGMSMVMSVWVAMVMTVIMRVIVGMGMIVPMVVSMCMVVLFMAVFVDLFCGSLRTPST